MLTQRAVSPHKPEADTHSNDPTNQRQTHTIFYLTKPQDEADKHNTDPINERQIHDTDHTNPKMKQIHTLY